MNIDRKVAARMAMMAYIGETCRYCGHEYTSFTDLRKRAVVWAHYPSEPPITGKGQSIACKACFDAAQAHKS